MSNQQIITDYLLGHLTEADRGVFEQQLSSDAVLRKEVEELRKLWQVLQSVEVEIDTNMDTQFYRALQGEKMLKTAIVSFKPQPLRTYIRYAAALAGIGLTFWMGRQSAPTQIEYRAITAAPTTIQPLLTVQESAAKTVILKTKLNKKQNKETVELQIASLRQEVKLTQELVILGLLKNHSASERLRGLNYVTALNSPNPAVIQALIKNLREDESLNVRLSTIEALEWFKIKDVLVGQLTQSTEPIEQLTLIETLLRLRAKESLPALQQLEKDPNIEQSVRFAARNGISELNATE